MWQHASCFGGGGQEDRLAARKKATQHRMEVVRVKKPNPIITENPAIAMSNVLLTKPRIIIIITNIFDMYFRKSAEETPQMNWIFFWMSSALMKFFVYFNTSKSRKRTKIQHQWIYATTRAVTTPHLAHTSDYKYKLLLASPSFLYRGTAVDCKIAFQPLPNNQLLAGHVLLSSFLFFPFIVWAWTGCKVRGPCWYASFEINPIMDMSQHGNLLLYHITTFSAFRPSESDFSYGPLKLYHQMACPNVGDLRQIKQSIHCHLTFQK